MSNEIDDIFAQKRKRMEELSAQLDQADDAIEMIALPVFSIWAIILILGE